MSAQTAWESASLGRHRAIKAEVVPARDIAKSDGVGDCHFWPPQGDWTVLAQARCQFELRWKVPLLAVIGRPKQW